MAWIRHGALRDSGDWQNGTDGFVDIVASCDTGACTIADNLSVSSHTPVPTTSLGPSQIDTYFLVDDPTDGADPPAGSYVIYDTSTVIRVSVFSVVRVGDQAKTTSLYTDLTNWRNR